MDLREDGSVSIGGLTVQRNQSFLTVIPNTVSAHEVVDSSIHHVAEVPLMPPSDSLNDEYSHNALVLGNNQIPQTLNTSISSAEPVVDAKSRPSVATEYD